MGRSPQAAEGGPGSWSFKPGSKLPKHRSGRGKPLPLPNGTAGGDARLRRVNGDIPRPAEQGAGGGRGYARPTERQRRPPMNADRRARFPEQDSEATRGGWGLLLLGPGSKLPKNDACHVTRWVRGSLGEASGVAAMWCGRAGGTLLPYGTRDRPAEETRRRGGGFRRLHGLKSCATRERPAGVGLSASGGYARPT